MFRDLDGHAWEVAHNPGFGLADDGSVVLPALLGATGSALVPLLLGRGALGRRPGLEALVRNRLADLDRKTVRAVGEPLLRALDGSASSARRSWARPSSISAASTSLPSSAESADPGSSLGSGTIWRSASSTRLRSASSSSRARSGSIARIYTRATGLPAYGERRFGHVTAIRRVRHVGRSVADARGRRPGRGVELAPPSGSQALGYPRGGGI